MNTLTAKLKSMTSGELYEVMLGLAKQTTDEANTIFEAAMEIMESKVSEEKYLEICARLELAF